MDYKTYDQDSVTPSLQAPFFPEHLARYLFAQKYIQNKKVLELGCGKGYGAYALAQKASAVVACDLNEASLNFARVHYAASNLEYKKENVAGSEAFEKFDAVVSFEVLEHLSPVQTKDYLELAKSCLLKNGVFLISTPNHAVVLKSGMSVPEFHINNLSSFELLNLLKLHFEQVQMLGQISDRGFFRNTIYYLDPWNLRHSSIFKKLAKTQNSKLPIQNSKLVLWDIQQGFGQASHFIFSRYLWRQAGMVVAICSNPKL